jgi:hypothetical protein
MPRILITDDTTAREAIGSAVVVTGQVITEVVTLSEVDGIYTIRCTGDGGDECPDADDLNETWLNRDDPIAWAVDHVGKHELRRP